MNFFQKLFPKKENPIQTYADFWLWFQQHAPAFHGVVKQKGNIDRDFFAKVSPQLAQLHEGYFLLTGMLDPETVELVVTAEGNIAHFVFVEELIAAAPGLKGWKFTALKPAILRFEFGVSMADINFDVETLRFFVREDPAFPDAILLAIAHRDLTLENRSIIENGCLVFLDNFLGELNVANNIDEVFIVGKDGAVGEEIPLVKLSDYLAWRQSEFVEKYDGERRDTEHDTHTVLTAEFPNGNPFIATINQELLQWDRKASHPWMAVVELGYDGAAHQGMPNEKDFALLAEFEDAIMAELHDHDGYLNIGHQTAENMRTIFFACREFRKPSKVLDALKKRYAAQLSMDFSIYKDKYWRTVQQFERH